MQVTLVQYSPVWEDKKSNKDKLSGLINNSGETDLLIFPEMTLTGFTMKSNRFFEELKGESFEFYSSLAVNKKSYIIAGIIEKEGDQFFNTALVINKSGELVSKYRKIHPFSYSSENEYYTGGKNPVMLEIEGWRTGLTICYDLRFPELYRFYGKERASLIINIANWPDTRIHHWNTLLKARAIENQCYVAALNRIGKDPKLTYPGSSVIIDPMGNEVLKCGDREGAFTAGISIELVNSTRTKFPFLNDIKLL